MIHDYQITLYFFHKSCPIESRVCFFNNSPKCMIKIFLESDKFSHKAGVAKHATNSLARKLHNQFSVGGGALLDRPCMVVQRMCVLCL